jgi:hypothetical protein
LCLRIHALGVAAASRTDARHRRTVARVQPAAACLCPLLLQSCAPLPASPPTCLPLRLWRAAVPAGRGVATYLCRLPRPLYASACRLPLPLPLCASTAQPQVTQVAAPSRQSPKCSAAAAACRRSCPFFKSSSVLHLYASQIIIRIVSCLAIQICCVRIIFCLNFYAI